MSTIEGGMVCTNDKKIFYLLRMLRSHGMARELGNNNLEKKLLKNIQNYRQNLFFSIQ